MIKIKNLNESYSALVAKPPQTKVKIANLLKARPKNYMWSPMYKSGVWDGYKKFYTIKNDYLIYPKGFNDIIKDFANQSGIEVKEINETIFKYNKEDINDFIKSINLPFEIRDYQKKAIHLALYKGRGVFEMATGCLNPNTEIKTNKGILTFKEIKKLLENNEDIEIETLNGYEKPIYSFTKKSTEYEIIFDNGTIKCADTHLFLNEEDKWIMVKDLEEGMIVKGKETNHTIKKINKLQEQEFIDFEMPHHHYIVNDIINHNSGKSLVQAIIAGYLLFRQNQKSVLIVPNVSLVEQFYSDFLDYFKDSPYNIKEELHKIYAGKEKHFNNNITLTTWQSLVKSEELFEEIDCLIVDEVHKAKDIESKLSNIIIPSCLNAKYKFGFTGSIPKGRDTELSLIGSFGKIYNIIKAKDLIQMGFGTPIDIIILRLKYSNNFSKEIRKFNYQQEKKFFEELKERNDYIIKLVKNTTEKFGNTLILFDRINHGYKLLESLINGKFVPKLTNAVAKTLEDETIYLNNITEKDQKIIDKYKLNVKLLEDENIFFVYGDVEAETREIIRQKVEEKDKAIIVANYQTYSTGINIKKLNNLIFASSTKSFTTIVQSLGRTIRKHSDKEKVRVYDIVDDCSVASYDNYMIRHFKERLSTYMEEEHTLKEKITDFNISERNLIESKLEKEDNMDFGGIF